ncbi:hypothetical protein [Vulcanococcus sp. Clear-D1]|jgi:hypothetical protein|uniref:hypothetical protein n=1 Tax=Vulcanococcus sp. Clear-D1 TaxID=2766970 RepID=UPI00199000B9|nr:hypothetical protein [Vulcanococcus sp. Clear-D1]MBD1193919.1 hypothetical protein [Vulcanococcus sp. Clear-D1]MBD1193978.1 hypothetical protein [Vulcanococcus sp. Clear-D1]
MAVQPTRAFLHEVVTSATGPDGTLYVVGYVFDADHDRHLVFATSANFEDPRVLPLMKGQEINLTCGSPCLEVLPLSQQSEEVQHHVAEQLSQLSIESLICIR